MGADKVLLPGLSTHQIVHCNVVFADCVFAAADPLVPAPAGAAGSCSGGGLTGPVGVGPRRSDPGWDSPSGVDRRGWPGALPEGFLAPPRPRCPTGSPGARRRLWVGDSGHRLGRVAGTPRRGVRGAPRVTCRLSKASQMTSPEVRASRSRLVRDVTGELAKSKDMHACVLTHAT